MSTVLQAFDNIEETRKILREDLRTSYTQGHKDRVIIQVSIYQLTQRSRLYLDTNNVQGGQKKKLIKTITTMIRS